jgi:hypothetical protein
LLPSPFRLAGAIVLAGCFASAVLAGTGLQWRLGAQVPVMCAVIEVDGLAGDPASLAITTTCNAERYQLLFLHSSGQASLRAAHSSAGPVQISGGAVTISSTRPGQAITIVALTEPVSAGQLSVTLQPI